MIVRGSGHAFGSQLDAALCALQCEGLDVVMDSLGGDYFLPAYQRMKPMGRHVQFGMTSSTPCYLLQVCTEQASVQVLRR